MNKGTVHLFVFEGMADWEAAFAVAVLRNPQFQSHPGRFRVETAGRSRAPIRTMGGICILPDITIDEVSPEESSLLILPGGEAWEQGGNLEALERAYRFAEEGTPVAAICAATLGLARIGLLDGRLHTSNAPAYLAASCYRGGEYYRDIPAITDRNVVTAAGTAPIEFAYEIFKLLDVYEPQTLDAWYGLYKHGDAARYYDLIGAAAQ